MPIATNTFPVSTLLAKAALRALRNKFVLTSRTTTSLEGTFNQKSFKPGDTVSIKLPPRYVSGLGAAIVKNNTTQSTVSLTLVQRNIGLGALTKDITLSIDRLTQFVDPAMAELASAVDGDAFALYWKSPNLATPGAYAAGAPAAWTGADLSTLRPFLDARARMVENGMPEDDECYVAVSPSTSAGVVDGLKGLFQDASEIAKQYRRGLMGISAGFQWLESQLAPRHLSGTRAATGVLTNGVPSQGATSIVMDAAGNGSTVNRGDQFVIANVFAINKLGQRVAGNKLQVFTATAQATADGAGNITVPVFPALSTTAPNQTISAMPADNAAVTFMGAANLGTDVGFAWHRSAIYSAFIPLEDDLPGAKVAVETDPESGISVRVVTQYAAETDEVIWRADVLYGFQVVRPELTCRIQG